MENLNLIINSFISKVYELINEFDSLDEREPFNSNIFNGLKSIINSLQESSISLSHDLDSKLQIINDKVENLFSEYNDMITNIDRDLVLNIKSHEDEASIEIANLNAEINSLRSTIENDNYDLDSEIGWFLTSSEQSMEKLEFEYNEGIKQYAYQNNHSNESYSKNIIHFNETLAHELGIQKKNLEDNLKTYDSEVAIIISKYNEKIDEINQLIEIENNNFKNEVSVLKEKRRNENVSLNNKIRNLVEIRDIAILEARNIHRNSINDMNDSKNELKDKVREKNIQVGKSYIENNDKLDIELNAKRKIYNDSTDDEIELYNEKLLEIYKQQEADLKELLTEDNTIDKNNKAQAKKIHKAASDTIKEITREHKYVIKNLDDAFNYEFDKKQHEKKIYEIERSSALKVLTEEEIRNNKYFQEIDNQHENDLSYSVSNANYNYSIDANNVRLNSESRISIIELDIIELEANHQIIIEKYNTQIKKLKLEIDILLAQNKLTHEFENIQHAKASSYLTVSNILNIERCKVLSKYNEKQYELNRENAKCDYEHALNIINLENEKYTSVKNLQISLNNAKLKSAVDTINHKINNILINKKYGIEILNQQNKNEHNLSAHNLLTNRFKLELKAIHQSLSSFINIIKHLEHSTILFIDYIFDNITFRPEYLNLVNAFVDNYITIAIDYYSDLISEYKNIEVSITNERINFEEVFKYEKYYADLRNKYNRNLMLKNTEKESIQNEIDILNASISKNNMTIFDLENDILYMKIKKEKKSKIKNVKLQIKELILSNTEIQKSIEAHQKAIDSINNEIQAIEKQYIASTNEIRAIQHESSQCYHKFRTELTNKVNVIINTLKTKNDAFTNYSVNVEFEKYKSFVMDILKELTSSNIDFIKTFYKTINDFAVSNNNNLNSELSSLKHNFEESNNKIKSSLANELATEENNYKKIDRDNTNSINTINKNFSKLDKQMDKLEQNAHKLHQDNIQIITNKKRDENLVFSNDLNAINDNLLDLENSYYEQKEIRETNHQEQLNKIINDIVGINTKLDEDLEIFIKTRNTTIKDVPKNKRYKRRELIKENKVKTIELSTDINNIKSIYNSKKREVNKKIIEIDATLQSAIVKIESEKKLLLKQEKRRYALATRK